MNVTFREKRCKCTRILLIKTSVTYYGLDGPEFETRREKEIFLNSASHFQNGLGASSTMNTAALSQG